MQVCTSMLKATVCIYWGALSGLWPECYTSGEAPGPSSPAPPSRARVCFPIASCDSVCWRHCKLKYLCASSKYPQPTSRKTFFWHNVAYDLAMQQLDKPYYSTMRIYISRTAAVSSEELCHTRGHYTPPSCFALSLAIRMTLEVQRQSISPKICYFTQNN